MNSSFVKEFGAMPTILQKETDSERFQFRKLEFIKLELKIRLQKDIPRLSRRRRKLQNLKGSLMGWYIQTLFISVMSKNKDNVPILQNSQYSIRLFAGSKHTCLKQLS